LLKPVVRPFAIAVAIFFLTIISAHAASKPAEDTIKTISVEGNQRIEADTVKSFLKFHEGDRFSPQMLDLSLQNIYATGLFSDVTINLEGNNLIVKVVENPVINEVAFEGNKRIKKEDLEKELKLKSRSVYNKNDLQNDVARILDIYHKSGRFAASIDPKLIKLDQNRVNLVYEINEGKRTTVGGIYFAGNHNFYDTKLKSVIQTKETAWYRFFSNDDSYDADRLAYDQELLRKFYNSKGYADFKVTSYSAYLDPEKNAFYITFSLSEGEKYKFGKISTEASFKGLDIKKLQKLLKPKEGETFNADLIDDTVQDLTKELGNQGFAFVTIDPKFDRDRVHHIVGVDFIIKEGPRVYVQHINIHGNVRTEDQVIRREFRLAEGDPYNADLLRRSQQRIKNLGYFDKAEIKNNRGEDPDKVDIDVDVTEKSTGELTLGAGFSTTDGLLANIVLSERNLLGTGQSVRINTVVAQRRQEIDLSYTEPYFMDKNVSAGFDIFDTRTDLLQYSQYEENSVGFDLRATYQFNEHLSHTVKYTLKSDNVYDIQPTASDFIQEQAGTLLTSMIGHSLLYDKTDNKFDPSTGYYLRGNEDFAGLGGQVAFLRHEMRAGYFIPTLGDKWILKVLGRGGYVFSTEGLGVPDHGVNIPNRFFLGGDNLRGFRPDGVGPHDKITSDALGGDLYYAGTIEHSFPLGLPEELGFYGSVFTDFGSLYRAEDKGPNVEDSSTMRIASGVGFSWSSPLGPIRIDFAKALLKNTYDQTEIIHFSFGTKF